jgi:hypothetical protein
MFTAALSIIALVFVQRRRYPRDYQAVHAADNLQQQGAD